MRRFPRDRNRYAAIDDAYSPPGSHSLRETIMRATRGATIGAVVASVAATHAFQIGESLSGPSRRFIRGAPLV